MSRIGSSIFVRAGDLFVYDSKEKRILFYSLQTDTQQPLRDLSEKASSVSPSSIHPLCSAC